MQRLRLSVFATVLAVLALVAGTALASPPWWKNLVGGGPPQARILSALERIEQRLDGMDARLGAVEQEVVSVRNEVTPCTPDAVQRGQCAPEEMVDLTAQVCVTLGAEAVMEAKYGVNGKTSLELGVGWDSVVEADLVAGIEGPLLLHPFPGVYVPVPDLELKGGAKGGLGVNICFRELELPAGGDPDGFGARLVAALESNAPEIRTAAQQAVESRGLLQGGRLAGVLGRLDRVGAADLRTDDPLAFFRPGGELRQLVDDLPVGQGVRAVLDDPQSVYPIDAAQLAPECDRFVGDAVLDPVARDICDALAELPDLDQVRAVPTAVARIEGRVQQIEQKVNAVQDALANATTPPIPEPPSPPPPPPLSCPGVLQRLCDKL